MEATDSQLIALFDVWRAEIDAEPFAHDDSLRAAVDHWAYSRRHLAGLRRVLDTAAPASEQASPRT